MPKTYITREAEQSARLSAWIYGQMKLKDIPQWKLAEERGITQSALNRKLKLNSYSFDDFAFFIRFFEGTVADMAWIAGAKGE